MTSAIGVTSAPSVPFRRFLPHEKPVAPDTRPRDYHAADVADEQDTGLPERMPFQMLSDEDMGVLMEARLESEAVAGGDGWTETGNGITGVYLPFTFALAARP